MRSSKPEDRAVVEKIGVVFPNQASFGTHVNIAGAAVAKNAPQSRQRRQVHRVSGERSGAELFRRRQQRMAGGCRRQGIEPGARALGTFKTETIPVMHAGKNQAKVQQMLDRVGYK